MLSRVLRPKTVIIQHYDNWRVPYSEGISSSNRKRAQRMENAIKAVQRKSRPYLFHFQLDKAFGSQENHAGFDKFATVFGRPT